MQTEPRTQQTTVVMGVNADAFELEVARALFIFVSRVSSGAVG